MVRQPRVFVSYSHDDDAHKRRVIRMAERLRADGVPCHVDAYVGEGGPDEGWPKWMEDQLLAAEVVLVISTERYHARYHSNDASRGGLGASFECVIIRHALYESLGQTGKYRPVQFDKAVPSWIPMPLRPLERFVLDGDYIKLHRWLTDQPEIEVPVVGDLRIHDSQAQKPRDPAIRSAGPVAAAINERNVEDSGAPPIGKIKRHATWLRLPPVLVADLGARLERVRAHLRWQLVAWAAVLVVALALFGFGPSWSRTPLALGLIPVIVITAEIVLACFHMSSRHSRDALEQCYTAIREGSRERLMALLVSGTLPDAFTTRMLAHMERETSRQEETRA